MSTFFTSQWTVVAFGSEHLTVDDTAGGVGVTTSKAALNRDGFEAKYGFFSIETAPLRYWFDRSVPDASNGHLVQPGQTFEVFGAENLSQLRMIRTTGTSVDVMASYAR